MGDEGSGESPVVEGTINVTDVFGLGRAANSKAAQKIAEGIGSALGIVVDPIKLYLTERAEGAAQRHELIASAKASNQIDAILADDPELARRTRERFCSLSFGARKTSNSLPRERSS